MVLRVNLGVFGWPLIGQLWPLLIIALGVVVWINNLKEKRRCQNRSALAGVIGPVLLILVE
jgi:hypothetical protein